MGFGKLAIGAVAALAVIVVAWANLTMQGRLISRNLMGYGYATPAPERLAATPATTAVDLSGHDVDFSKTPEPLGGLTELQEGLSRTADIQNQRLALRGVPERAGWYSDRSGPFYYRVVSGDFMVETGVRVVNADDGVARPEGMFNSAGLLVRDPTSDTGSMRWVMYNIGQQAGFYGTEAKSTAPDLGTWHMQRLAGFKSASTLWLTPAPEDIVEARLRICRIGAEYRFFKQLPGSDSWTEETQTSATVVMGNRVSVPTAGVVEQGVVRFIRPDIPEAVQVGLINNPGAPPNDGIGLFSDVRFSRVDDFNACASG